MYLQFEIYLFNINRFTNDFFMFHQVSPFRLNREVISPVFEMINLFDKFCVLNMSLDTGQIEHPQKFFYRKYPVEKNPQNR